MMGDELGDDLDEVSRAVRAGYLDAREVEEEATEQLTRKEADLVDIVLEAMHRGQPLRVRVGTFQFDGSVVHVGEDMMILEDGRGAQVDVCLGALDELWIGSPMPGAGRGRRSNVPTSFADCLEGLEATRREVELGGQRLPPLRCRVGVAARDHLVLDAPARGRVIPRAAIGFVIRRR
jgi:hypothetical protein